MSEGVLIASVAVLSNLLGGAGVWAFLTRRADRRHDGEERELDRLRIEVKELKQHNVACEQKVDELERRLEAVEHHHGSYIARWIKDARKRIIWVNSTALLQIFAPLGHFRTDVVGRTFAELLDEAASREVDRLDRAALARPGMAASTLLQLHSQLPAMHVVKVAGPGRDGELIYEGYAYCANDPAEEVSRGEARHAEQIGTSKLRLTTPSSEEPPPPL